MRHGLNRIYLSFLGLFFAVTPLFAAEMADIGEAWSEFAEDNSGRLPVTADIGLGWSDAYIGELIDLPPHYGFGLTVGMNSVRMEKLNALTDALELPRLDALFAQKQFFPAYVLESRLGGFRDAPFDIGFKIGYLPALFPIFGDLQYENLMFGGDMRYNINRGFFWAPKLSVGFGVNYLTGYFLQPGYTGSWGDVGGGGSDLRITWNTVSFLAKLVASKSLLFDRVTLFIGLNGGVSISETGLALVGDTFTYQGAAVKDMTIGQYGGLESALGSMGNGSEWEIKDNFGSFGAWGKISTTTVTLHTYEGVAFDFDNNTHLQLTMMFDLAHLEFGMSVGYRWQQ